MTELLDKYFEHRQLTAPSQESYEGLALSYAMWYKNFLPTDKNARILDVGCGMGGFLFFLEKQGYTNYWGIDLCAKQIEYIQKHIAPRVTIADGFDYLRANGSYNLIVLNDALEHVPKERVLEFLTVIYKALEPNGLLFIKTDNMSNPFSLASRYIDFTHEIGFSEHSLRQILSAAGFDDVQITGEFHTGHSLKSWVVKVRERLVHKILEQMFKAQRYLAPNILEPNLIAVCTKR
jgi:2-polyprenyl-3-methyl-5-hydroxy-6-metoxy-1,4-benzoquinol methylase